LQGTRQESAAIFFTTNLTNSDKISEYKFVLVREMRTVGSLKTALLNNKQ